MLHIIDERDRIFELLGSLPAGRLPVFGKMTPQHMVEHLGMAFRLSNGRFPQGLFVPPEKAARTKNIMINSDRELGPGAKMPLLGDEPPALMCTDLPAAIALLEDEMKAFDRYFGDHPDAAPVHPVMDSLNHAEWIIVHTKHLRHHFRQFGLI